jgi:uncharacterized membrane protein
MKKLLLLTAIGLVLSAVIPGCEHTSITDSGICFERDIQPIFNSKCAMSGCHDAGSSAEGYILDSYNHIVRRGIKKGSANNSNLYEVMASGEMPPRRYTKLSSSELTLIRDWINAGAPNGTNCPTVCDSTVYTFSGQIQPLMNKYCVGCHSASNASAGVDVSSYTGVKNSINSGLVASLDHTGYYPMPKGGNKLTDCEIAQVKKWIASGAPNN